MSILKCPRPECTFQFDSASVPDGTIMTCPDCGMRFTLGPVRSPAAGRRGSKPGLMPGRSMLILGGIASALVAAAVLAVVLSRPSPAPSGPRRSVSFQDINLIVPKPEGWTEDSEARQQAKANVIAFKKVDSSARVAFASHHYDVRNPMPGELRDGLLTERLEKMFDVLDPSTRDGEWLGQRALHVTFRGRRGEKTSAGEGWGVAINGYAYWMLAWSAESEFASWAEDREAIRTGCRLIDPSVRWKPRDGGAVTIAGVDYRLLDGDRWWEQQSEPKSEDPKADLWLIAKYRLRPRPDVPPKATAVVYRLEPSNDPQATLLAYVKARYAKLYEIRKWHPVQSEVLGDPPAADLPINSSLPRYHAESEAPHVSKLVVLNAIRTENAVIGIEASCPWNERSRWEARLLALATSLQP